MPVRAWLGLALRGAVDSDIHRRPQLKRFQVSAAQEVLDVRRYLMGEVDNRTSSLDVQERYAAHSPPTTGALYWGLRSSV
jgi:hypothetical protein